MYEVRGRPLLRCLIAPVGGGGILIPVCFAALILLFVGGWVTIAAASFLALYEWRAYSLALRADRSGLHVKNFFLRHHIPWRDLRGVWAPARAGFREVVPTLSIERRDSVFFQHLCLRHARIASRGTKQDRPRPRSACERERVRGDRRLRGRDHCATGSNEGDGSTAMRLKCRNQSRPSGQRCGMRPTARMHREQRRPKSG